MMKKYIFSLLIFFSFSAYAQNMKSYFISMPDSIIPLLTKVNREDCVDFLESNMKAEVKNRFGKPSELKRITDNYLLLQTTPYSSVEMKLLQVNDSTSIIGVAKTYIAKTSDSDLSFYSTDWKSLDVKKYITLPLENEFSISDSISTVDLPAQEIKDIMDIPLRKISFNEEGNDLSILFTAPETLGQIEQSTNLHAKERKLLKYKWMDGRYAR